MSAPPTHQQSRVLTAVSNLTVNGIAPSFDELTAELGISKSNLHRLLCRLRDRGLVTWIPYHHRSLAIVERSSDLDHMPTGQLLQLRRRIDAILDKRPAAS